jgi:hypothetical protein
MKKISDQKKNFSWLPLLAFVISACGVLSARHTQWQIQPGPGGMKFAIPPGWKVVEGKEGDLSGIPEPLRSLERWPGRIFIVYHEKSLVLVSVKAASFPLSRLEDEGFRETVLQDYQQVLELLHEQMSRETAGRFRIFPGEYRWLEEGGLPAALNLEFRIQGEGEEIPAQMRILFRPNITYVILAVGDAPLEEFLRRSSLHPRKPIEFEGGPER